MKKKILIIGATASGTTLATRLRRINEDIEIILFEKTNDISIGKNGLPYYVSGVIAESERLHVQTEDILSKRFNLDIRVNSEVIKVNEIEKTIVVNNNKTKEEYVESYDELVFAVGSKTKDIENENTNNLFTLKNISEANKIKKYISNNNAENISIIGGTKLGVEFAQTLNDKGYNVKIIDENINILNFLDKEMVVPIESALIDAGIEIMSDEKIKGVFNDKIVLMNGKEIETDVIINAQNSIPNIDLAKVTGLEIGECNGIKVDERFQTSIKDIYAIGDVIEINSQIINESVYYPKSWSANRQARVLADILNNKVTKYGGTINTNIIKVGNLVAASVGFTIEELSSRNIDYKVAIVTKGSDVDYNNGAKNITLKLIFGIDGKIYGAQGFGYDGVDKRIDVIATAMQTNSNVDVLEDLELCFTAPFSSAKDPVNILGYVARNIIEGDSTMFEYNDIEEVLNDEDKILIDVRTPQEYNFKTIKGAINIPLDTFRENMKSFESYKDKKIYLFCQVGQRAHTAQNILRNNGYNNTYNLTGGIGIYDVVQRNNEKKINFKQKEKKENKEINISECNMIELDARGLQCPGPIMATSNKIEEMKNGETLRIKVTDNGFTEDIKSWCEKTNNMLISVKTIDDYYEIVVQKGNDEKQDITSKKRDNGTIVMFSGDMDKALASMIIAQGAQAMGKEMTIFFTFWGLNMLRKEENIDVDKTNFEKMFGAMMPKGAEKLPLSQMNMAGIGTQMIKSRMKDKNVPLLKQQMESAQKAGVKFIACTMSMDLMGIKEEELIDGVDFGGVAKYIGETEGSDLSLFI